jgi:hypothetical protein
VKSRQGGDYEVRIKIRNGRILSRVRSLGFESIVGFCRANELPYQEIVSLINMGKSAVTKDGQWRRSVLSLSAALGIMPEDLFTNRQLLGGVVSTVIRHVDEDQLLWLDGPEAQTLLSHTEAADETIGRQQAIAKFFDELSPTQRRVVEARFGFNEQPIMTLDELAEEFNVHRVRIQQIENGVLRKAKHPRWKKILRPYVDPDCNPENELTDKEAIAAIADLAARKQQEGK